MQRTVDINTNRILDTVTPPDVVQGFTPRECQDNIARLNGDEQIENNRHDEVIAKITSDRQLFQERYDYGIANGLTL